MKTVRVGLVGLGFMGTTHFRIYQELPQVKVTALADVDPDKRRGDIHAVCGNIGGGDNSVPLDLSGVKIYADALEMIASADIDMVDICVPTPDHARYVAAALAAGRHVFAEKPLCRSREEMLELRSLVQRTDRFFNVGMCIRAWPEYVHARDTLLSGAVGRLRTAHFRRLSPSVAGNSWQNWYMNEALSGGALLDLHLHDTDAVRHFFGRPRAVASFGVRGVVSDHGVDQVFTRYDFGDDTLVTAEGGWCAARNVPFEMSFQLVCELATLKLDGSGYHVFRTDGTVETPFAVPPELPTGWHRELKYFTDCVRSGTVPDRYQTPDSIFDSYELLLAEAASIEQGRTVEVEYV